MKKLFLIAALVGVGTLANAQYKPASGDKTLEVNFTPLSGTPIGINGVKLRMFTSETSAYRLGVNINYASTKTAAATLAAAPTTTNGTAMWDRSSTMGISLQPGMEMHMGGTDRLSPYMGAVLDIGFQSSTDKSEFENGTTADKVETNTTKGTNGFFRIGAGAVAGADYYISNKLYMGVEVGYGLQMINYSTITSETTVAGAPTVPDTEQGSSFNFGPTFNGAIRLGYAF